MRRVCILGTTDISRMTMLSIYTEYFEKNNIEYDLIYVDKFKEPMTLNVHKAYAFDVSEYNEANFLLKLSHYWKMRKFAKKIFHNNEYDFLVIWGEFTAFIFADIISKYYSNQYCVNIRDYFYNNVFFVKHRIKIAIRNSRFTTVSSDAFIEYLPNGEYLMLHSLNKKLLSGMEPKNELREEDKPIRILYLGLISRLSHVYKFIDELGNDMRFELIFAGIGSDAIDKYIQGKNIINVKTYGRFPQEETSNYLDEADILYNLYGVGNKHFDTALSIKLYYAIYLNIPILTYNGTHTQKVAEDCGISFSLKENDFNKLGDRLATWYRSLNQDEVSRKCNKFIDKVNKSHYNLYSAIEGSLFGEKESK